MIWIKGATMPSACCNCLLIGCEDPETENLDTSKFHCNVLSELDYRNSDVPNSIIKTARLSNCPLVDPSDMEDDGK
jgi:hypothetical protein